MGIYDSFKNYLHVQHGMDLLKALHYDATVVHGGSDYTYEGDLLTNQSQSIYEDEITWTDIRDKPDYQYLQDLWNGTAENPVGCVWYFFDYTPTTDQRLVYEVFPQIDEKAAKSTTINGHYLSANVTLATTDLDDFNSAVNAKIAAVVNAAPSALDTLSELATALLADESTAAALATTVGNKVDKVTGKGLSANDFTSTLLSKLNGIQSGATSNDTDANLKNRANHTGTQTASTISDFAEAAQDAIGSALSSEFVYDDSGNGISLRLKSFAQPSRTSGTAFQISTTRDALVSYTATTACAAVLLTGSAATMTLKYADNAGMTTNLVTLPGDSFGLPAGLVVAVNGTMRVSGVIPAGKYVLVTTAASLGTPTMGGINAQEVLL